MENVILLKNNARPDLLEAAQDLMNAVKSGECTAIIGIIETGDTYHFFGGQTMSRHKLVGMLMELAVNRLVED